MTYKHLFSLITSFFLSFSAFANSAPPDTIHLQLKWFHQFQFAGYYAAVEKGFYIE
jgi:ABC-type nitrate/sulfonate/bicarbonate transport system substrate-binding protein